MRDNKVNRRVSGRDVEATGGLETRGRVQDKSEIETARIRYEG